MGYFAYNVGFWGELVEAFPGTVGESRQDAGQVFADRPGQSPAYVKVDHSCMGE